MLNSGNKYGRCALPGALGLLATCVFVGPHAAAQLPGLMNGEWRAFGTGDFPTFAPNSIVTGDLNNDQHLDVVVGREYFGGPGVSVLFGRGDGTYSDPVVYELSMSDDVGRVALHDFDMDGDPDVLATIPGNFGSSTRLGVWRNDGTGALDKPIFFTTGAGPVGLVIGEFTGDQFDDVVTANNGYIGQGTTISLLEHNGKTGAQAGYLPPVHTSVGQGALEIDAADLDHDQDLDLVVGRDASHPNTVLYNDGSGGFGGLTDYIDVPGATNHSPAVRLRDVTGDGFADLIAGGAFNGLPNFGQVSVRVNDQSGNFGSAQVFDLADWTFTPRSIELDDVNGDQHLDLIVTTPSGRSMDGFNVLFGDGDGGFGPATFYKAAKQTFGALGRDADEDDDLDVITVANDSSVITVHENIGDGILKTVDEYKVGTFSNFVDAGDIDNDGDIDLVSTDLNVQILRNNGDGTFAPPVTFKTPFNPGEIRLRDMNNDHYLDLLLGPDSNSIPYDFATALNNGDGTFAPAVVTVVGASQAGQIDAFDLDNDTYLDVVLTDPGPADLIHLAENTGDGSHFIVRTPLSSPTPWRIAGADLDHDDNIDLVSSTSLGITVYPGNGDFTFGGAMPTGVQAFHLGLAFLDDDDNEDLFVLLQQDSFGTVQVATMRGFGDGTFAFPKEYTGPNGREGAFRISSDIDAADISGDGILDVILTNNAPGDLSVFVGNGDTTLQPQQRFGVGYSPRVSAIGDFDNDRALDVACLTSQPPSGLDGAIAIVTGNGKRSGIELSQTELHRDRVARFTVNGAQPNERVYYLYSFAGLGDGPCPPALGGLCLDLLNPITNFGSARADGQGTATLRRRVPANAPLRLVYTQAVVRRGSGGNKSVKSNAIESMIQP